MVIRIAESDYDIGVLFLGNWIWEFRFHLETGGWDLSEMIPLACFAFVSREIQTSIRLDQANAVGWCNYVYTTRHQNAIDLLSYLHRRSSVASKYQLCLDLRIGSSIPTI